MIGKKSGPMKVKIAIAAIIYIPITFLLFIFVMNAPLNPNEHMYLASSALIQNFRLYRDFAFIQTPLLPLLYGLFFKVSGTTHYLFFGRLFSLLFLLAAGVLIYGIAYNFSRDFWASVLLPALMLLNEMVVEATKEASNYTMAIALSLAGFYLFIGALSKHPIRPAWMIGSGFLLGLSVSAKLYYVTRLPAFFLVGLVFPMGLPLWGRLKQTLVPLAAGMVLGLVPCIYYFLADAHAFMFCNLKVYSLYPKYAEAVRAYQGMTMAEKFLFAKSLFWPPFSNANSLLPWAVCIFAALGLIGGRYEKKVRLKTLPFQAWLAGLVLALSLLTAFVPMPTRIQYFGLPVPFAIAFLVFWAPDLNKINKHFFQALVLFTVFLTALSSFSLYLPANRRAMQVSNWKVSRVHADAMKIRELIGPENARRKIATPYALFALESGLPIYPEFASAMFVYNVGDQMSPQERNHVVTTAPAELSGFLQKDPPGAIIIGFDDDADLEFIKYAEQNHYQKAETGLNEREQVYIPNRVLKTSNGHSHSRESGNPG